MQKIILGGVFNLFFVFNNLEIYDFNVEFFFQQVGKVPSAIFIFLSDYLKKAKTSDLTLKNG